VWLIWINIVIVVAITVIAVVALCEENLNKFAKMCFAACLYAVGYFTFPVWSPYLWL
jgi:hypothetical protein